MRKSMLFVVVVGSCALLFGCRGKAIATADLHGSGTADVTFQSTGAPLTLWADCDGKWTGGTGNNSRYPVHYEIDVKSKGAQIGHISCDTKDSNESVCGTKISNGSNHEGDCEYKLACSLPAIPAGEATLHVTAAPGPQVTEARKNSINIRDK